MSKCDKVKLSELIIQKTDTEQIVDMENEHYITLSLYGKGARERVIKDGKYPVPFTGYRVSSGQFIYSRIDARNGAYAIIGPELDGFVVSKDFPVFDINESKVLPHFLRRAVLSADFINQVKNSSFGATNRMRIKEEVFETYSIPLPELSKQNEIVDIMDRVETIINSRQQELQKLDDLIKARFAELFGNPVLNDKGWEQKILAAIASKIGSGATPKGGKEAYRENGIALVRSMNVHNGRFEYKDLAHISDEQAGKLDNVTLEENDVLLNITGASVARSCVAPSEILPARVNQHVCIIRCKECIVPEFLNKLFINDNYQVLLRRMAGAGATREAITKQQVESLHIIMPPLEIQQRFADFVVQTGKSKAAVQKSLDETQVLFDSLMQKYFG